MKQIIKEIGTFNPNSSQRRIIYDKNYICPTLQAAMGSGGGNVPMVIIDKSGKSCGGTQQIKVIVYESTCSYQYSTNCKEKNL